MGKCVFSELLTWDEWLSSIRDRHHIVELCKAWLAPFPLVRVCLLWIDDNAKGKCRLHLAKTVIRMKVWVGMNRYLAKYIFLHTFVSLRTWRISVRLMWLLFFPVKSSYSIVVKKQSCKMYLWCLKWTRFGSSNNWEDFSAYSWLVFGGRSEALHFGVLTPHTLTNVFLPLCLMYCKTVSHELVGFPFSLNW